VTCSTGRAWGRISALRIPDAIERIRSKADPGKAGGAVDFAQGEILGFCGEAEAEAVKAKADTCQTRQMRVICGSWLR